MNRVIKVVTTVVVLSLTAPWTAFAQDATPALLSIRVVDVLPGKAQQFEAALKTYGKALNEVAPNRGFGTRTSGVGGPGDRYFVYTFLEKLSDLQPRNVLAEALGEDQAAAIAVSFDEAIADTRVETFVPREDLSRRAEVSDFEVVRVIRVNVAIGGEQAFEDYLHKLIEATDKVDQDANWFGYAPGIGAGTTYRFAIPMKWADLDTPGMSIPERLQKAFGEQEAAKILASHDAVVTEAQSALTVGRPDLSFQPSAD